MGNYYTEDSNIESLRSGLLSVLIPIVVNLIELSQGKSREVEIVWRIVQFRIADTIRRSEKIGLAKETVRGCVEGVFDEAKIYLGLENEDI